MRKVFLTAVLAALALGVLFGAQSLSAGARQVEDQADTLSGYQEVAGTAGLVVERHREVRRGDRRRQPGDHVAPDLHRPDDAGDGGTHPLRQPLPLGRRLRVLLRRRPGWSRPAGMPGQARPTSRTSRARGLRRTSPGPTAQGIPAGQLGQVRRRRPRGHDVRERARRDVPVGRDPRPGQQQGSEPAGRVARPADVGCAARWLHAAAGPAPRPHGDRGSRGAGRRRWRRLRPAVGTGCYRW